MVPTRYGRQANRLVSMVHSPKRVALPAFRHAKPILGNEIVRVRASLTLALCGAYRYRCDRAGAPMAVLYSEYQHTVTALALYGQAARAISTG